MLLFEKYDNIYKFTETVNNRADNGCFGDASKEKESGNFSGTKTWEEAVNMFENGIPESAEKLKKALDISKVDIKISITKVTRRNYYYGYTPNVSAAIIGLPKSMRQIQRTPQKVKAISIYWLPSVNSGVNADTIQKSGETVAKLIYTLEIKGYKVSLHSLPYSAAQGNEQLLCCVTLKEFKQPLDMLKLSFPLTSPAYFRRFGFRWAETMPGVTNKDWHFGYGSALDKDKIIAYLSESGVNTKDSFIINVNDCKTANFDPLTLAKELGISI